MNEKEETRDVGDTVNYLNPSIGLLLHGKAIASDFDIYAYIVCMGDVEFEGTVSTAHNPTACCHVRANLFIGLVLGFVNSADDCASASAW